MSITSIHVTYMLIIAFTLDRPDKLQHGRFVMLN